MHYHVTLELQDLCAAVELQGDPLLFENSPALSSIKLPTVPNTYETSDAQTMYWIGPQRWLLRAELDREVELNRLSSDSTLPIAVSAVLVSDTLSFFKITGVDAGAVIAIASPMDVHPSVFPKNGASYTEVFGLKALIIRCDDGFEVAVERSYTAMLLDYFQRAIGSSK